VNDAARIRATGTPAIQVNTGKGCHLDAQMIADAANRPVVAGPVEATAIGNLLVQLVARDGGVDLRTVRAVVRDSFELVRYEPRDPGRWEARLARG
jgi:sugar (pentulose or hexulose) kinase